MLTFQAANVPAAQLHDRPLFLAVFAVVTFYLAIASLRTDLVNAMMLWLAFASIVLLSIGARATTQSKGKQSHAERVEGIICGVDGGERGRC